jgi:Zn-dependent M28 family amino/carboxypeptidase
VRVEPFEVPVFEEHSPPRLSLVPGQAAEQALPGDEVRTLAHSGGGEVSGPIAPVDLGFASDGPLGPSTSGCEAEDFASFPRGAVALLRRGTCPFQVKVERAVEAGAAGLVIMNEGGEGRTAVFSGNLARSAPVPVLGVSTRLGRELEAASRAGIPVRLGVNAASEIRRTHNVIAETPGDPSRTVVVGAHLDSVPEGPGMNDNASGSAVVLETALRLARGASPVNRVRFAFWGAEERGLIGSRHHVDHLAEAERRAIVLYVNLDMVGSVNSSRVLQGGGGELDGSAASTRAAILRYFAGRGLAVEERSTSGMRGFGSDMAAFAAKGIPWIGLYTGAGELKSPEAAARFGGEAGHPHDACYHRACDDLGNVNPALLEDWTEALTRALGAVALKG